MTRAPHLRVFLSSPQDVAEERAIARRILERLPYDPFLRGRITIEIVAWDGPAGQMPLTATLTPQAAIERGLPRPSQCDIVVVILWNRIGTPLPETYRRADGTRYASGTEWEYDDAFTAADPPQILIYRRVDLPTAVIDSRPEVIEQRKEVERFFSSFRNSDGSLRGGVNTYREPNHFEEQLEYHLRELLSRVLMASGVGQDRLVQPRRLDAATPAQAGLRRITTVHVQLCVPASRGSIGDLATDDLDAATNSGGRASSPVPLVFPAESGTPKPTLVDVDVVAPHHDPHRSTQSVLLNPSMDSPRLSFALEPRHPGRAHIHVSVAQALEKGVRITCGTVTLESNVSDAVAYDGDELWSVARRLIGAAAAGSHGVPGAKLTLRVVEDAERKTVEKYLTLEIPQLSSILAATRTGDTTIYCPEGQSKTGSAILEEVSPALERLLAEDTELMRFVAGHPEMSDVDLVLLLEEWVAAAVPSYSPRVVAVLIVKSGLLHRITRRPITGPPEA